MPRCCRTCMMWRRRIADLNANSLPAATLLRFAAIRPVLRFKASVDHCEVCTTCCDGAGGANGIGLAICCRLAQEGARVFMADIDAAAGPAALDAVRCAAGGAADVNFVQVHCVSLGHAWKGLSSQGCSLQS